MKVTKHEHKLTNLCKPTSYDSLNLTSCMHARVHIYNSVHLNCYHNKQLLQHHYGASYACMTLLEYAMYVNQVYVSPLHFCYQRYHHTRFYTFVK